MVDKNYNLPPIKRQSALDGQIESGRFGNLKTEPGIFIKENHPLSIVQLETREPPAKDFLNIIKNLFKFDVPPAPNTSSVSDKTRIIWTGPNRWLIVEPETRDLTSLVKSQIKENSVSIVDLSHARSSVGIDGLMTRDLLLKGAAIDFHPEVFLVNHCVQTTFFNLSALICCLDKNRFNIFIARGFALDLWQKVQEAAEEFGYETL
jgi:sarcosine oxidase subunit gamma